MRRIIATLLPIFVIALLGYGGCQVMIANKPEPVTTNDERQALSVFAERIERRDLTLAVTAQGEVRPRNEVNVTPQVGGRIAYIADQFEDGGYLAKGQVIARLDTADYELAVVRAKAGVASAQQRLFREEAEAELAIRDLEELGVAQSSPLARREPQLAEAKAALDSAYAQLSEANLALERTIIRAPFDARIRERTADLGQFVSTGQALGRVFSVDSVQVSLPLTDEQIGQLNLPLAFAETNENPGPEVVFTAAVGGKMRTWRGRITRTAAAVNSQSRLITAFGEVEQPYGTGSDNGAPMAPGLFVTATVNAATVENVLWAPRAALRGNDELYIGNPDEGTLSIRPIDVLHSDTEGAYFNAGAVVGELAVISPVQAAFDGMRLTIRERLADGSIANPSGGPGTTTADAALTVGTTNETEQ